MDPMGIGSIREFGWLIYRGKFILDGIKQNDKRINMADRSAELDGDRAMNLRDGMGNGVPFFFDSCFFSLPSVAKAKQMSLVTWHGTVVPYLPHWLNNICANERWRGIEFRNI